MASSSVLIESPVRTRILDPGGAGKGTVKDEKERVHLLEKQLKTEREKAEKLARGF